MEAGVDVTCIVAFVWMCVRHPDLKNRNTD